jgi:hypothetical protein
MTKLQQQLAVVRHAWTRTQLLKALAVLAADVAIAVLLLVGLDAIYHLPDHLRAALLVVVGAALVATALVLLVRSWRRPLSDTEVALYVEERFPKLQGRLLAAVEYEPRASTNPLQTVLVEALVADCLRRAAQIDLRHVIDKRRLTHRAIAAGTVVLLLTILAASRPQLFRHELARVLTPWVNVPPNEAELAALRRQQERTQAEREILDRQEAEKPKPVVLTVEPGDTEVRRGTSLTIHASANRITDPVTLKLLASDGQWRTLDMPEDSDRPDHFTTTLADLTESTRYQVVMGSAQSPEYRIGVYDPTSVKQIQLVYHYPAYARMADATVADNPAIEAIEGTVVQLRLTTTAPLQSALLQIGDAAPQPLQVEHNQATATIPVDASGQYQLAATDLRGQAVVGLDQPWSIKAIPVPPPIIEVLYPANGGDMHPMEEVAFAAKLSHSVGLKELRLYTAYGTEDPVVQKIDYAKSPQNIRSAVGQFTLPLRARAKVEMGDAVAFRFEAEDLKGQVASTKISVLTVRELELFMVYSLHHHHEPHAHGPPLDLFPIVNATHDLEGKRKSLAQDVLKAQCATIAKELEQDQEPEGEPPVEPNP